METVENNRIARLVMKLRTDDTYFNYHKASLLQGVLMQRISTDYAEHLHNQGLKPYSQYYKREGKDWFWYVQTLNDEAYREIMLPLLTESFQEFYIEHDNQKICIEEKTIQTISLRQLMDEFYEGTPKKFFQLEFITPTAFKINGKYSFFPDVYHIYASCMKKLDAISEESGMFSKETLEQISEVSEIVGYNLRSVHFEMEGVRIPAFIGKITIAVKGNQTMCNFVNLLLRFGEFSGIGIKTAMGMGAVRLIFRREEDKGDD